MDAKKKYIEGLGLLTSGDLEGARDAYEAALASGSFPEAEAAQADLGGEECSEGGPGTGVLPGQKIRGEEGIAGQGS